MTKVLAEMLVFVVWVVSYYCNYDMITVTSVLQLNERIEYIKVLLIWSVLLWFLYV